MKKILLLVLSVVLCFSFSTFVASADEVEEVTLRLGSFPGFTMDFMNEFAADVAEASDGKITIEVINFLTLGSPVDAVMMTKDGALDMIIMSGNDYVGYSPASSVIAVPLEVSNVVDAFNVEMALRENNFFTEWEGEVISTLLTDMQYVALAKKEITNLGDFSGLIGRCQANNGIAVLQNLGAAVTTIQTNEVYNALNTGVIDFSVSSPSNMVTSSYQEVVKYILDQPLYCDANCLIMNQAKFDSLSPAAQEIIKACGKNLEANYQEWNIQAEQDGIQTLKDAGVEFIPCPDDVLAKIQESAVECKENFYKDLESTGIDTAKLDEVVAAALAK